jgi:hypothetical protein
MQTFLSLLQDAEVKREDQYRFVKKWKEELHTDWVRDASLESPFTATKIYTLRITLGQRLSGCVLIMHRLVLSGAVSCYVVSQVSRVKFVPDLAGVVTSSLDKTLSIVDIERRTETRRMVGHTKVAPATKIAKP